MVVGLGVIGLILSVLIFTLRYYFNQKLEPQNDQSWSSRTKYAAYDVYKHSGIFFRSGLICAVLLTLPAFNYTQYNSLHESPTFVPDDWFDDAIPPITYPEPKPIPPPSTNPKNAHLILAIEEITQPMFVEAEVKVDVVVDPKAIIRNDAPALPSLGPNPPPLPKIEIVLDDEPRIFSEFMPRMCSGCDPENISREEKNDCATKEMMLFVQKQLKYPTIARENGIQGMCPVRFVVRSDGSISDIQLLRDIGAGCGKEALRVTTMLKDQCWKSGIQNGRRVSVQMVLPIRFKLQ